MTFTISADDPRTIRALEIAAQADQWLRCRNTDDQEAFGVPSQSESGRYYLVTRSSCDCPDFRNGTLAATPLDQSGEPRACKHMLAVRLFRELVKAQQHQPRRSVERRRDHLTVVPRTDAESPYPAG